MLHEAVLTIDEQSLEGAAATAHRGDEADGGGRRTRPGDSSGGSTVSATRPAPRTGMIYFLTWVVRP